MLQCFIKITLTNRKMNDPNYNYYEYSSNLFYYER